jgi:RHS repeat-associated protein
MSQQHRSCLLLLLALLPTFLWPQTEQPEELPALAHCSSPHHIAALRAHPSALVDGKVNALSGALCLQETDLIARGAQPIVLTRTYITPTMPAWYHSSPNWHDYMTFRQSPELGGWSYYNHLTLRAGHPRSQTRVRVSDPSGMTLDFDVSAEETTLVGENYGLHNVGPDGPSGQYDPQNSHIKIHDGGERITVHTPDGFTREYLRRRPDHGPLYDRNWLPNIYTLEREYLPNGKLLCYHYEGREQLIRITSHDPQQQHQYAALEIERTPQQHTFTTHTRQRATYHLEQRRFERSWTEKLNRRKVSNHVITYSRPFIRAVSSPAYRHGQLDYSDRFLLTTIDNQQTEFQVEHQPFEHWFAVASLSHPLHSEPTHQFHYNSTEGETRVVHCDGSSTTYHYSPQMRVERIEQCNPNQTLVYTDEFIWNAQGWLIETARRDAQGNAALIKTYAYDDYGNPIIETHHSEESSFTIKREFSTDGRHLLLREEHDDRLVKQYTYLPGTNLKTAELIGDHDQIIRRQFWCYDNCHNLITEITDDGQSNEPYDLTNVTERRRTSYILRQHPPCLHLPDRVAENYTKVTAETATGHLLKQTYRHYDDQGNIQQEDIFYPAHDYSHTLYYSYNERGDRLTETNALGQLAHYDYDAKGRRTHQTNFANTLTQEHSYDRLGRLTQTASITDSETQIESYTYTPNNLLASETNYLGYQTDYRYHPVHHKVIETTGPTITTPHGSQQPVTSSRYDAFGRKIAHTDARGHTTTTAYNGYDQPTHICHPDGSQVTYCYYPNGRLKTHTDQDGLTTTYTHDLLGRVTSKTFSQEHQIATENYSYNAFHLIAQTDRSGTTTTYQYDAAGRKTEENHAGHRTTYQYDNHNQLATICRYNGDQMLITSFERDKLGRPLTESRHDHNGQLLWQQSYTYDAQGNRNTITHHISPSETATESFTYDPFNRLIATTDPLGAVTHTTYSTTAPYQIITTQPNGNTTTRTYDPYRRLTEERICNFNLAPLAAKTQFYDLNGNPLLRYDEVYQAGIHLRTVQTQWIYDAANRPLTLIEAGKTTSYSYTPKGRLASQSVLGGTTQTRTYDPLGYLATLNHYTFERDALGRLLSATDQQTGTATERTLDTYGNVISETLANGLTLHKAYDDFNRLTHLTYPDGSQVVYHYDPLYLRQIERLDAQGNTQYSHHYNSYDLRGRLATESLIADLGQVSHTIDRKGRHTAIASPYFSQSIEAFDLASNPTLIETDHQLAPFAYDDLSQLTTEPTTSYTHDSLYNRTSQNGQSAAINESNQLTALGTANYTYDGDGRLTTKSGFQFRYDGLHRLVKATSAEAQIAFAYDALDRCIEKTVTDQSGTSAEHYFYHSNTDLGTPTECRVVHPTRRTAVALELNSQVYAPLHDLQRNVRRLVHAQSQKVAAAHDYTAFGQELTPPSLLFNPWRFASKRIHPIVDLVDFGKRFYDPTLGRWLTPDPAGFVDSLNLYQFCFNNPLRYFDPDGQFIFTITVLTWGASIAIGAALDTALIAGACALVVMYQDKLVKDLEWRRQFEAACHPRNYNTSSSSSYYEEEESDTYAVNRFTPDSEAEGDHSTFRGSDPTTEGTDKYETWRYVPPEQKHPDDERPDPVFVSELRYDGNGHPNEHYNGVTGTSVPTPHVHDPNCPGGVRPAEPWEIPQGPNG